jgi:hypothetical protein
MAVKKKLRRKETGQTKVSLQDACHVQSWATSQKRCTDAP